MKVLQICINCGHAVEAKTFHEHFPRCYDVYFYTEYEKNVEHNLVVRKVDIEKDWK